LLRAAREKPGSLCYYTAPTHAAAESIEWFILKKLAPSGWIEKVNETKLTLWLKNGSRITLKGVENADALRGVSISFLVMDEFPFCKEQVWQEVLRPACADQMARVLFIGTPHGHNWAKDLADMGASDAPEYANWNYFSYTTAEGGNVSEEELEAARLQMDERAFAQEYLASFETLSNRVYSAFSKAHNVSANVIDKHPEARLFVGEDFNVSPSCMTLGIKVKRPLNPEKGDNVTPIDQTQVEELHIFDEIIMENATTEEMAEELRNRYPTRPITIYPDPSGRARKTSAPVGQTDFTILRQYGFRVIAPSRAPKVVDRVNEVNAMLCNVEGLRRLHINPKCKELIRGLEGMTYKQGTSIPDKSLDIDHAPDALGYLIHGEYPLIKNTLDIKKVMGI